MEQAVQQALQNTHNPQKPAGMVHLKSAEGHSTPQSLSSLPNGPPRGDDYPLTLICDRDGRPLARSAARLHHPAFATRTSANASPQQKIQILSNPHPLPNKPPPVQPNPTFRLFQINSIQVNIQKINKPRHFYSLRT